MNLLRAGLILMFATLATYTILVVLSDGIDLVSPYFGDIFAIGWPGQFNLDFLCYLILSATWVAWRHRFSSLGMLLAALALVGGILFFAPYLLVTIHRSKGSVELMLTGVNK